MSYYVNCQHQFYSGRYIVEIAYPGIDYAGSDMLATDYPGEGEYDDPREALDAAIKVREALQADHPDEEIGIAFGHFEMVEGEPQDLEELKKEIMEHYASLPKCDRCGKLRDDKEFFVIYGDPDYGKFCSEFCAEEAFTENEEPMEESTTHD
ncbi:hypothetical protein [Mesotoga prima]|uniref:hypothetical protein n=1 Tax=Mesotoga prima TaxID=1184387 RepID=UPI002FDB42C8